MGEKTKRRVKLQGIEGNGKETKMKGKGRRRGRRKGG
jgi:hypothetical protein